MNFIENKIPPPLVALIFAVLMWLVSPSEPNVALSLIVQVSIIAVLVLLGVGFSVAGLRSFKLSGTTINPLTH